MKSNEAETPSEREMSRLLGLTDVRAPVPTYRESRVKQAVLEEVRAVARRRRTERRAYVGLAVLGSAAAVVLAMRLLSPRVETPAVPDVVATIERVEGDVRRIASSRQGDTTSTISRIDRLAIGDGFDTGETGRLGVRFLQGTSLRFDRRSRVRLVSTLRIELEAGAVYFDGARELQGLDIQTPLGLVKDIGTQFEVRLVDDSLRVRVRSGIVEVHQKGEVLAAHAGTQLTIGPTGRSTRTVPPYGPEWAWATSLAAPFETNGRSLGAFLDHVCREQGWTLTYATAPLARQAAAIVLHGSLDRLPPTDALEAALSASGLRYRLERGELFIER